MRIVRFCGGLGNQFYQYAFGKAMGEDVIFNKEWYNVPRDPERPFEIEKFNVNITFTNSGTPRGLWESMIRKFNTKWVEQVRSLTGTFKGYWQHPMYYSTVLDRLKNEFVLKPEFYTEEFLKYKKQIEETESVMVHVRRGDYVSKNACYVLPFVYYIEAISRTKGDLFVFSDDLDWCKELFKEEYFGRNITFVNTNVHHSFELMRICKTKIIANSTFSYWSALINKNDTDIVIAPKNWRVKEGVLTGLSYNFPKHWIAL